ncbi:MAG TPA: response regulator, partial [Candidatus Acidoferrum sp.]|nr:response regulator [Candidatus Acidoferrum sp.]
MRCPDEEVGGFAEEEKAMAARILVADDSVTIQKVVELTFSKEDFVLVQARSGEEAIRKAKEERPDLVLLDLVMPDKNGYEVCAALRAEPMLRAVPVILLAGTFEAFDKDKGIQAGASDFVTKPFESQVLISKVKQLLFNKTVTTAPAAPAKTAAPKEATQQAPPKIVPPAGMVSRPAAASAATPGPLRGTVPPSPAPPQAPRPAAMASGASGIPTPSAATPMGQVLPRAEPPKKSPLPAAPVTASITSQGSVPKEPTPPKAERTLDLSPPSEEISEDRVRSVVEPPSRPPRFPAGKLGELSREEAIAQPVPETSGRVEKGPSGAGAASEDFALDLPSLAPAADELGQAPSSSTAGAALPESLSLEDLLSAEDMAAPPATGPAATPLEDSPGGPVFDLTSEMGGPSLPLVEVGTGEPPALSIEELLATAGAAPPPPEISPELWAAESPTPGEKEPSEPVFDLTDTLELSPPSPPHKVEAGERAASSLEGLPPLSTVPGEGVGMGFHELELETVSGPSAAEKAVTEPASASSQPDLGAALEGPGEVDLVAGATEIMSAAPPSVVPPPPPSTKEG